VSDDNKLTSIGLRRSTKSRLDGIAHMYSLPHTVSYDVILNYMLDKLGGDIDE